MMHGLSAATWFWLACGALALTAGSLGFALTLAPSTAASRLGLRGLKRQSALERSEIWRHTEPLVRFLGGRFGSVLSKAQRERIDRKLSLAGDVLGLSPEEYLALSLLSTVFGVGLALAFASVGDMSVNLLLMFCLPLGALLPHLQIAGMGRDRLVAISRGLPFVVDLMGMAMSAGLDFPGAVRQVVEKAPNQADPTIEELTLMLQGMQVGRSRQEVLRELARRAPCDAVLELTGALIQAEQRGNPIGEVLQIQAATYRTRRSVTAEEAAAKAGVQMTAPLFLVFVSVLMLVLGPMLVGLSGLS
jgi:tight adherence protein C